MKIRTLIHKSIVFAGSLTIPILVLTTTNFGLNTLLTIGAMFSPIGFSYKYAEGRILGADITIHGIKLNYAGNTVTIDNLKLNWQQKALHAKKIKGTEKLLPLNSELTYQPIQIDNLDLKILDKKVLAQLSGNIATSKLQAIANLTYLNSGIYLDKATIDIDDNFIKINSESQTYLWKIFIDKPKLIFKNSAGKIYSNGTIENINTYPTLKGFIDIPKFTVNDIVIDKLSTKLDITYEQNTSQNIDTKVNLIKFHQHEFKDIKLQLFGSLAKHKIQANLNYKEYPLALTANGKYQQNTLDITKAIINFRQQKATGNVSLNLADKKIHGSLDAKSDDLSFIMQTIPTITNLKGQLAAKIIVKGTMDAPVVSSNILIKNISTTIPNLGIKIKPMELNIYSDNFDRFNIKGHGNMRRGPGDFTIEGYLCPFRDNMPNSINIKGSNVEFINNQLANLIASFDIFLNINKTFNILDVDGKIDIQEGSIAFAKQPLTTKSKDIVFVNEANTSNNSFQINPDLYLHIHEGVKFKGLNLETHINGNLHILYRNHTHYAEGTINLSQGTYALPGQNLFIDYGRLIYPSGALLVNPILDIKLNNKDAKISNLEHDKHVNVFVQGTAQKPIISEQGFTNNQDIAVSQAIFTGTNALSKNILYEKFKISEVGLKSSSQKYVTFFDDPSDPKTNLKDKDFVIGRPIGNKLYLQYLHGLGEPNKRIRLKYSLNHMWDIGLESGTKGSGIDLGFVIEKD